MDDYLSKPVRLDVLAETVGRWLVTRPITAPEAKPPAPTPPPDEVFDSRHLRELCDGDVNVMRDLVLLYVSQTRTRIEQIVKACESGDVSAMQRVAHTAKGSSSMMGVTGLVGPFRDIELVAKDTPKTELDRLVRVASDKFDQACKRLTADGLLAAPTPTPAPG
jgi:HPt (histidine-containing phosphotransfer) domain-containing protein